jgi:hypothetical protein
MSPGPAPAPRDSRPLYLAAWILLPLAAHLGLSWFGFNPTDDGFTLAMSRRLLDGQIPHRDFISIRPVGSPLIHIPEVWLGGSIAIWLGRLVTWCEFAVIAFCWVEIAARLAREPFGRLDRFLLGMLAFVLSSHTFPVMPWHTIDALALVSCGVWLASKEAPARSALGFLLVGSAALCRQNFLALVPFVVVALGCQGSWRAWLAALAPVVLYVLTLAALGALPDAGVQLAAQVDLLRWGVVPYARSPFLWCGLVLGLGLMLLTESRSPKKGRSKVSARHRIALVGIAATLVAAGMTMLRSDYFYLDHAAFMVFGLCAGQVMVFMRRGAESAGRARLLILAVGTAWTAAVSLGYNTPALATGGLAIAALFSASRPFRLAGMLGGDSLFPRTLSVWLVLALLAVWIPARLQQVYLDRQAPKLDRRLDGVLPGGALIVTNENTYEFLADLQTAQRSLGGTGYALVPDCAALWIGASHANPLPIDWPQAVELSRPELLQRVLASLDEGRGKRRVLVQKVYARQLKDGFFALTSQTEYYAVVGYVRSRFRKVGETRWFEVYE